MCSASHASSPTTFYGFLHRMRHPAAIDIVRSIKSFIVSFSFHASDAESDSQRLQDFLLTMENTIRGHPLWSGATEEEIDNAVEGLEKYVMTKLFNRTFACSLEDAKFDQEISEKIYLLQHFIKPEHLDVPAIFHNEASWLIAEKELQRINAYKSPCEKLCCIFNCCKVINNLLINASMSSDHVPAGADEFLPVIIYVTIKANPPHLHSNLKFIQLFRRQTKLISEAAYYLTNLISAKLFIVNMDAHSLSIDESEFQINMEKARLANKDTRIGPTTSSSSYDHNDNFTITHGKEMLTFGQKYPFMEAEAGELTVEDVHKLLSLYKQVVTKYSAMCEAVRGLNLDKESLCTLPH